MHTNYIIKQSVTPLVLLITFITSTVLQAEQQTPYYQPRQAYYPQPKQSSSTASTITKGIVKGGWNVAKIGLGLYTCQYWLEKMKMHRYYIGASGLLVTIDGFIGLYKLLFKRKNKQNVTPTSEFQVPTN